MARSSSTTAAGSTASRSTRRCCASRSFCGCRRARGPRAGPRSPRRSIRSTSRRPFSRSPAPRGRPSCPAAICGAAGRDTGRSRPAPDTASFAWLAAAGCGVDRDGRRAGSRSVFGGDRRNRGLGGDGARIPRPVPADLRDRELFDLTPAIRGERDEPARPRAPPPAARALARRQARGRAGAPRRRRAGGGGGDRPGARDAACARSATSELDRVADVGLSP